MVLENRHEYRKQDPWWRDQVGEIKWASTATKMAFYHQKSPDESTVGENETIADATDVTLRLTKTKDHYGLRFHLKSAEVTLPHDFHMAAAINELLKQEDHVSKWFKKEYVIAKRKFNF